MKEIWKEIIDYETFYEVSTFGNVRRIGKTKLLYPNKNKVILCKFGSSKAFNIAKLFRMDLNFKSILDGFFLHISRDY